MNANEVLGIVLGAIMTLAGAFYFFHDKITKRREEQHTKEINYIKEQNHFREKQLQATERTNHLLEMMNQKFDRMEVGDEKRDAKLVEHGETLVKYGTRLDNHQTDIEKIKSTVFKKDYVK